MLACTDVRVFRPAAFFDVRVFRPDVFFAGMTEGTQSSLITIMSLWNTMMGTSILSMPWALEQARALA